MKDKTNDDKKKKAKEKSDKTVGGERGKRGIQADKKKLIDANAR